MTNAPLGGRLLVVCACGEFCRHVVLDVIHPMLTEQEDNIEKIKCPLT